MSLEEDVKWINSLLRVQADADDAKEMYERDIARLEARLEDKDDSLDRARLKINQLEEQNKELLKGIMPLTFKVANLEADLKLARAQAKK